jgi:hypothetical protein
MGDRLTLCFTFGQDCLFHLHKLQLDVSAEWEGDHAGVKHTECAGGHSDNPLLLALAFVRVAQYRYLRLDELPADPLVPVFGEQPEDKEKGTAFKRFRDMLNQARRDQPGATRWLRLMMSLESDPEGIEGKRRLERWFAVSEKKAGHLVSCDLGALPPEAVRIMINDEPVTETALDDLEVSLSLQTRAGVPCHWDRGGISAGGRLPSIRPQWYPQEEACQEAAKIYAAGQAPLLCVIGPSGTGKTIFAYRWFRRMKGTGSLTQRFVFSWSFRPVMAASHIQLPSSLFFRELANFLLIDLPEKVAPLAKANLVLEAIKSKPSFFLFDGLDAMFSREAGDYDTGVARLLQGIAESVGSFVLATSTKDFADSFGLPQDRMHRMRLKDLPLPRIRAMLAEYDGDSIEEPAEGPRGPALAATVDTQTEATDDGGECVNIERLNQWIQRWRGSSQLLLVYIICVALEPIGEQELVAIADGLPDDWEFDWRTLGAEERDQILETLVRSRFLLEAQRHGRWGADKKLAGAIMKGLKTGFPGLWAAINTGLGQRRLAAHGQREVWKVEEIPPLVEAAIYFCRAGKKHIAYHEIGMEKLSHGLKGYSINCLGDYQSPKTINAAILDRDPAVLEVQPLPPDVVVMCQHTSALCSRYLNQLETALTQERAAWEGAKRLKSAFTMLPIGSNLLRLHHIFGLLGEAKQVEWAMLSRAGLESFRYPVPWRRRAELPREDRVDGASLVFSVLALSALYRGAWQWRVRFLLDIGIKECRNNGDKVPFLLPTYGRPWHVLTLLETGGWEICERAIEAGDWAYEDMERFKQTGNFEALKAKVYLAKSQAGNGTARSHSLERAREAADEALRLARLGGYRWWQAFSSITLAHILTAQGKEVLAEPWLGDALELSGKHGFQLLRVDALLAQAEIFHRNKRRREALASATAGAVLAEQTGYGLRKNAIKAILKRVA